MCLKSPEIISTSKEIGLDLEWDICLVLFLGISHSCWNGHARDGQPRECQAGRFLSSALGWSGCEKNT